MIIVTRSLIAPPSQTFQSINQLIIDIVFTFYLLILTHALKCFDCIWHRDPYTFNHMAYMT